MNYNAAVILSLAFNWFICKKRRNLYLLSSYHWRLLALPYLCWTATQKPTLVYATKASGSISHEIPCRKQDNYISTGIYRCSILVTSMNFARIPNGQESARINAFLCYFTTSRSSLPQTRASARRSATAKLRKILMLVNRFLTMRTRIYTIFSERKGVQSFGDRIKVSDLYDVAWLSSCYGIGNGFIYAVTGMTAQP